MDTNIIEEYNSRFNGKTVYELIADIQSSLKKMEGKIEEIDSDVKMIRTTTICSQIVDEYIEEKSVEKEETVLKEMKILKEMIHDDNVVMEEKIEQAGKKICSKIDEDMAKLKTLYHHLLAEKVTLLNAALRTGLPIPFIPEKTRPEKTHK